MITKNLTPFFWGPKVTSRKPPQVEMALCVRGVFRLRPDAPLEAIEDPMEQGFMSGDAFAEDDIDQLRELVHANDFAEWKLNAEVLLTGACHPAGGPATESAVRFAVGEWSKTLQVIGPRVYKSRLIGGTVSEPQPFDRMPLTWSNAYGGDGFAENPVGLGHKGEQLPSVMYADAPIKKIGSKAKPATFAAISPQWPQRINKRGKNYGAKWKRTRAPFYSDDFDWTYFHTAPDDQQLEGYLRGDEQLTFENLHSKSPSWQQQLPGLRIRAFVKTTDGKIREPEMVLDTLHADLDDEKLFLTWRGHSPIQEIDMTDVAVVLLASEKLSEPPKPAEQYLQQLAEFEADPVGLKAGFAPGFLAVAEAVEAAEQAELNNTPMPDLAAVAATLPPDCPFPPWFLAAVAGDDDPLGIKARMPAGLVEGGADTSAQDQLGELTVEQKRKEAFAELEKLQDDPSQAGAVLASLAALLPPDKAAPLQEGAAALQAALSKAQAAGGPDVLLSNGAGEVISAGDGYGNAISSADAKLANAGDSLSAAKDQLASAPTSIDDAVANALEPLNDMELPEVPEIPDVEADLAAQSAKLDQDEARMRVKIGDNPMLGMFDMGRNLIANAPRPEDLVPDLRPIPVAMNKLQASLAAQGVSAAALTPLAALTARMTALVDKIPAPAPLPEGEFVAVNLRRKDFSNQDLAGANFCKSDLTGAIFCNANLTGADFTKADLTEADLTGATLTDATFHRATLSKARLGGVTAHRTNFADADLGEIDGEDADLREARFLQARAIKARLPAANLCSTDLRFADLSKADLRGANLSEANLSFATLNLVKGDAANFTAVVFDVAKITKSRLQGAVFTRARCNMGQMTASNLSGADLSECEFEKVDLMTAVLDDANFQAAKLRQVTFRDTVANRTNFERADLAGCSATGTAVFQACNFKFATASRSVWLDADLSGSNFRHSTFDNAFFQGARGTSVDFTATVLKHASFRKVHLQSASFAHADLASVIFQDAVLEGADFHQANCYDAKFLGASAQRCNFQGAFLVGAQLDDPDSGKNQEKPQ